VVGAHSLVAKDVEPHTVVAGSPAKYLCKPDEIMLRDGSGKPAYPWNTHFRRGYPTEVIKNWEQLYS
jgi:hypothetical protein